MTPQQELRFAESLLAASNAIADSLVATKGTPLQWIMKRFKDDASESLVALIDVDPFDAAKVRGLQDDVKRFRDTVRFLQEAIVMGSEAGFKLEQADREELADLALTEEGQE